MGLLIEDYALIGDCQTAALIGRNGSLDWLCFPRFDSPACFAALLGTVDNGRWLLAPALEGYKTSRSYRGDSIILETTFSNESAEVTLVDCMPIGNDRRDLVRLVIGRRGTMKLVSHFSPRFDYGSVVPWIRVEAGGVVAVGGPDTLHLKSPVPQSIHDWSSTAEFEIHEGEQIPFLLTWHPSHEPLKDEIDYVADMDRTVKWWDDWVNQCTYDGEWKAAVLRSLITLKALTYAPTGAMVAAPTTSLPEHLGGTRNWDYRYCWLRDATFTLTALLQNGFTNEAAAWREWLIRAVAGKGSQIHIMYGLSGERRLTELELDWLPGYEDSKPVRIGNGAHDQFQLDVFGETLGCLHMGRHFGLHVEKDEWRIELELLKHLEKVWQDPDEGIWEVRGDRQQFTHSKLMAWLAFDCAVKDAEHFGLEGPVDTWAKLRDQLHAEICDRAFNKELNSFVQAYESKELDAAVLVMLKVGFRKPDDPRIVGTVAAIEKKLLRDGFVERYHPERGIDGLQGGEGAFLLCTFWLADNYAMMGRIDDARRIFENLLSICNDVGLLAEEYDPRDRRQLGNFPQAFSHLGLINTARRISEATKAIPTQPIP